MRWPLARPYPARFASILSVLPYASRSGYPECGISPGQNFARHLQTDQRRISAGAIKISRGRRAGVVAYFCASRFSASRRTAFQPPRRSAVLIEKLHRGREIFRRIRIEIHGELLCALHGVDKFAVTTAKIDNCIIRRHILLKKIVHENVPDFLAVRQSAGEPFLVNVLQLSRALSAHRLR